MGIAAALMLLPSCRKDDSNAPAAPEITVEAGTDSFRATWTVPEGAVKFGYAIDDSPEFMTENNYAEFTDLDEGAAYTFKVRSYSASGNMSEWASQQVKLNVGLGIILPVQTGKTENSFTVSWEPVEGADGYEYKVGEGSAVHVSGTSVTVDKDADGNALEAGTEYSFSVRAVSTAEGTSPSDWATISVMTDYPAFSASVDLEIKDLKATSFIVDATPNDDVVKYYMTLSYSENLDALLESGKDEVIEYILSNVGAGVAEYTEPFEMLLDGLRPETGYAVIAVVMDKFDRYDVCYASVTTPEETVAPVESELYDILAGEWKGTQQGYAFIVPDKTADNSDPEPVLDSETALEASFDVTIVKDLGDAYSYEDHNQVCMQFKSFRAGNLDLGYKSYEDLLGEGWSEKDARLGYGPKVLIDIKEDGSMEIEGLYSDTPAYTWDERYNYEVVFMNITCDPSDSYMPSGDSLPLSVKLSADRNTLTISGSMGPGFKYKRSASAGPLWCAAGDMVLTRVQPEGNASSMMVDLAPLLKKQ